MNKKGWSLLKIAIPLGFMLIFIVYFMYSTQKYNDEQKALFNTPVTTISSLSEGSFKINGVALPQTQLVKCPISNDNCVYYKWFLEEYKYGGTSSHRRLMWVMINGDSSFEPIKIKDSSGEIPVYFNYREPQLKNLSEISFNSPDMPDYVKILIKEKLSVDDSYFQEHQKLRVTELSINSGEDLSVIGNVVNKDGVLIIDGATSTNFVFIKEKLS